ncbi:MAG: terpene cyclase/mutase family protein [Planctomycetes bacterium]|nr:terpene cyclase/mutase family protein [Planctomycetota bacterium]
MGRETEQRRAWMARSVAMLAVGAAGTSSDFWSALLRAGAGGIGGTVAAGTRMRVETRDAIKRGLSYLARMQNDDGSFAGGSMSRNVAVCSLSGLAMLSSGSVPGRGPYSSVLKRALAFVLDCAQPSGFIHLPAAASHGPMYEHGFAALFLAEVYGMSDRPDLRERLEMAVKLIVDKQNQEGGWRYQPERRDADLSITICQIMALRAARNAGLHVPAETIDRCVEYVKRCQNPDGGFNYMLSVPGQSRFPRSAAGVVALQSAGIYDSEEIRSGLNYLQQHLPGKNRGEGDEYFFYGHYYAVQAMWHAGENDWNEWYAAIQDQLLPRQRPDGQWFDVVSPAYGTAMACLILQTPISALPIFQR